MYVVHIALICFVLLYLMEQIYLSTYLPAYLLKISREDQFSISNRLHLIPSNEYENIFIFCREKL